VPVETIYLVGKILGGLIALAGIVTTVVIFALRSSARKAERQAVIDERTRQIQWAYQHNIPDLWKRIDDHERRLSEIEKCQAVEKCLEKEAAAGDGSWRPR